MGEQYHKCDGYCSEPYKILWGAAKPDYPKFACTTCNELHSMCANANNYLICTQIAGHEGQHRSISRLWAWATSDDDPVKT